MFQQKFMANEYFYLPFFLSDFLEVRQPSVDSTYVVEKVYKGIIFIGKKKPNPHSQ